MIMCTAKPIADKINNTVLCLNLPHVLMTQLGTDLRCPQERRIPNDRIPLGPVAKQRVLADDVVVEIVERQRRVEVQLDLTSECVGLFPALFERNLFGDVERDLGQLYRERVDVDAIEVGRRGCAEAAAEALRMMRAR